MLTLTPAQAADRLGVSGTALRRASPIYELIFGPLPREGKGGRLWPAEAVERLRLAFEAAHSNRVVSVKAALELLSNGDGLPLAQASGVIEELDALPVAALLLELMTEVKAIRTENAELAREVAAMRSELAVRRELPASTREVVHDSLNGVKVLRVAAVALPSHLRNRLRWQPERYVAVEAVLSGTIYVSLDLSSGRSVWRADDGERIRQDTVVRLFGAGVLVKG